MRTWIEIEKANIEHNYKTFRQVAGSSLLMGVVKSNAYGHSLVDFAAELEKNGIDWLGVDSFVEAKRLRERGIKAPLLVLGYTNPANFIEATEQDVSVTVADANMLKYLPTSLVQGRKLKVHLKIDSGMYRQGVYKEQLKEVLSFFQKNEAVVLEGVYTHFARSKDPQRKKETQQQISYFKEAVDIIKKAGFDNVIRHACATAGTLLYPEAHFDMVRIGIGLYGFWPSKETESHLAEKIKLQRVMKWKTSVTQVKTVPVGKYIGYGFYKKTNKETKIAVLPVGYWHGLPRSLSNKGEVFINNKRAKVLGMISMDMVVVDVSGLGRLESGTLVEILGGEDNYKASAEKLAELAGTTMYEFLTCINSRIRRDVV